MSIPRRRIPPTERFAAVVAGVVLLGLTALFVLLAIDFVAAATGSDFSPWGAFPVPDALVVIRIAGKWVTGRIGVEEFNQYLLRKARRVRLAGGPGPPVAALGKE